MQLVSGAEIASGSVIASAVSSEVLGAAGGAMVDEMGTVPVGKSVG